ncbi:hypothetical protein SAMN02746065_101160 [Desulfocicer vacuolatum DSM 3385]|uniref:Uncharacterized protein n=1 Tax=Desulfocicer vacuolatum DSM 3385 TaxID=1121400 RepID=A0A1W1YL01_9BACT|nr:hypothetical protein [Desulfocicer vacuolatum]SMC36806.1 hypothetical protein SAMN02746065_101160 [Desulfocicer vacuolatum DSM 3385]
MNCIPEMIAIQVNLDITVAALQTAVPTARKAVKKDERGESTVEYWRMSVKDSLTISV